MERERDEDDRETCASCGVAIDVGRERAFPYGPSGVLCHACAIRRGGVYDSERERWEVEPDLRDLEDERRPHR